MISEHSEQNIPSAIAPDPAQLIPCLPLQGLPYGFTMTAARFPMRRWETHVPPLTEDHLTIHLEHPLHLEGRIERPFRVFSKPGDIYVVPRGEPTLWQHAGSGHILFVFVAPLLLGDVALQALNCDPAQAKLVERVAVPDPLVHVIGQTLMHELQADHIVSRLYVESLAHTLLVHLLCRYAMLAPKAHASRQGFSRLELQRVISYIHEHPSYGLSLKELASLVQLSPYHFARRFKQSTGQSLHQYVLQQRLEAAKHLLLAGQLSLGEIAVRVGFHDQSHFCRHFKRRYGTTPGRAMRHNKRAQYTET